MSTLVAYETEFLQRFISAISVESSQAHAVAAASAATRLAAGEKFVSLNIHVSRCGAAIEGRCEIL